MVNVHNRTNNTIAAPIRLNTKILEIASWPTYKLILKAILHCISCTKIIPFGSNPTKDNQIIKKLTNILINVDRLFRIVVQVVFKNKYRSDSITKVVTEHDLLYNSAPTSWKNPIKHLGNTCFPMHRLQLIRPEELLQH